MITKENFTHSHSHSACVNLYIGLFVITWQLFLILFPIYIFNNYNGHWIFKIIIAIFSIFFIGTRMRALGNIIHECSHNTFVPKRKDNIKIGKFLCFLDFSDFNSYKKDHFSHHRFLGDPLRDEDFKERQKIGLFKKDNLKLINIFSIIFSPKSWFLLSKVNNIFKDINYSKLYKIFYYSFFLLFLGFIIGFINLIFFLIIPFLSSYQMLKLLSDYLDHGAIYFKEKVEFKSRNHIFSISFLNWIFFPRSDCYHLVHHLHPSVPTTQLAKKHAEIMKNDNEYQRRRHHIC
ncbi:fatty acid desaturase family protein [Fluviispira multicolorata]|uniref:Fatty acid desaturase domain-containing protein n=1 Tax=Fluviispira multicolorata TaxID=2654512 RepID=A0A833JC84_9BACT|nr:fatty acid desaturase [Fluviispira multicolorata]KAB8029983.1 hypothetical protein GCL57_10630 [Fluviispira multicolorata]